jgi:hypothetical protein
MAAYTFLVAEPTVQVLSPEIVRDAQRVTAQAVESSVVFSLLFAPYPTDPTGKVIWSPEAIAFQLADWASKWDTNAAVPGVLGIALSQDVDDTGQLKDVALVTVQSTSGNSTAQLNLYPHDFFPDTFAPRVAATREQLDATEKGA